MLWRSQTTIAEVPRESQALGESWFGPIKSTSDRIGGRIAHCEHPTHPVGGNPALPGYETSPGAFPVQKCLWYCQVLCISDDPRFGAFRETRQRCRHDLTLGRAMVTTKTGRSEDRGKVRHGRTVSECNDRITIPGPRTGAMSDDHAIAGFAAIETCHCERYGEHAICVVDRYA